MKSSLLKWYFLAFLLASDFVVFAQPGGTGEDGDLEGGGDPPAPINAKLIWLAIVGVSFAFYYFNKNRQEKRA
ncbi:hypothetical protein HYN59_00345 [Flavobacterium album]|uniref:Signal peptidase n=1 Tax=Flavobacterium album TaxID=2175091 RepID=A0A2S1QTB0_9FLAO|nr:hypothetical protein [Flavobacterium album]AWH83657.1 hypothetical protein HYN59_00345 [Flavobacterium album]